MDAGASVIPPPPEQKAERLSQEIAKLYVSLGFEGSRRNNIVYIEENILMHTCGNTIHFVDVRTMSVTYLPSVGGLGIGAVAIHPSKKKFAVCEKGVNPDIYIYDYPALSYTKVLKDGTERLFSAAAFKHDGTQLATVGGYPDYWLTVWDWQNETIILRAKAFSQEVFNVSFSRYFSGQLLTSGVGHIRFWKMASTFTGMKLEGFIGKFGQVPLSDIAGYVELSNGKVLSGTEGGGIIVWEGELVKCQLKRKGGQSCHDGMVEITIHDTDTNELITCGADGYIRFWDFGTWLDAADDGDEKLICEVNPLRELHVDPECKIKGILFEPDHWLIQDEAGALWRVSLPSFDLEQVLEFHAGAIGSITSSPTTYFIATAGSDATVRLYNFKQQKQIYKRRFSTGCTTMIWIPLNVDPEGKTVAVGFKDGVVRVLQQCTSRWRLLYAMKPHTEEVTGLKISPDGQILATVSMDATVFFFHCSESYRPIGFWRTVAPIRCLDWSPDGEHLLLGLKNCEIHEVSRPPLYPDTKITFELKLLSRPLCFLLPKIKKPKPPPPPEAPKPAKTSEGEGGENAAEGGEGEATAGADATVSAEVGDAQFGEGQAGEGEGEGVEGGEGGEEAEGDGDGAEGTGEEQAGEGTEGSEKKKKKKKKAAAPPPVVEEVLPDEFSTSFQARALLYTKSSMNTFYLSLEGKGGLLYECHPDSKDVLTHAPWTQGALTTLHFVHSSEYIVSGSVDGVVRINTTPQPGQLGLLQQQKYWEGNVHDCYSGAIGNVVLSYDNLYLASAAQDGSFFIYEMTMETAVPKHGDVKTKDVDDTLPDAPDVPVGVYSIEEDKQKTEQENKLRAALQKKKLVTDRLDMIRKELEQLIKVNKDKPSAERLSLEDFEIDSSLRGILENEIKEKVQSAREQLQWESERSEIALSKLRAFLLDPLEVEHIVLHAFRTDSHVASFRTEQVPREMKMIEEVKALMDDKSKNQDKDGTDAKEGDNAAAEKAQEDEEEDIITKQDLRRLQLKKKEDEYQNYLKTKPDESYANPEDLAAIEYAKNTKGDFKLKTDLTYIPPVEQRTNAVKKRNEMVLLYEAIHNRKMEFNREFLSLRDRKKQIRFQITQRNARIVEINNLLRIKEEPLYTPQTFKDETPEDRNNITKNDLDDYIERKRKAEAKVEEKDKAGGFGGFGGGPVKKAEKKTEKVEKAAEKTEEPKTKTPEPQRKMSRKMSERASRKTMREGEISSTTSALRTPSVLEQAEQEAFVLKLKYEKSLNKERIDMLISTFDNDLDNLRNQRFIWDIKIKGAELKLLILYQELRLLQILQPKEQALQGRNTAKLLEAEDLLVKISDQEKALDQKKQEVAALQEKKQQLLAEFEQMMGENNAFRDPLFKIYSKKIKRQKPKAPGEETDSEEESDLEAEGSDDDFEEEETPEVCPTGCEESLYASVLALRERRLDVEEVLAENVKLLDSLQREKEMKLKKKKNIDIALETIKREMGEFQKEKQNALNQIDVAITLYMHQVEYIENGATPADLSAALVFTNSSLKNLRSTIEGHVADKAALRRLQKELRKEYSALVRERRTEEENTADTEQRVIDVQMLRFGQVIDLSVVELIRVRRDTIELKERVKQQEMEYRYELGDWSRKLDEATDELARAMRENSASLYTIADLKEKHNAIESSMKVKARATFRDPLIEKRRDAAEQQRLRRIVVKNAEVIDQLEGQIQYIHENINSTFP